MIILVMDNVYIMDNDDHITYGECLYVGLG